MYLYYLGRRKDFLPGRLSLYIYVILELSILENIRDEPDLKPGRISRLFWSDIWTDIKVAFSWPNIRLAGYMINCIRSDESVYIYPVSHQISNSVSTRANLISGSSLESLQHHLYYLPRRKYILESILQQSKLSPILFQNNRNANLWALSKDPWDEIIL